MISPTNLLDRIPFYILHFQGLAVPEPDPEPVPKPEPEPELPMSVNIFMHLQHSSSADLALPHLPVTCPAEKSISMASCPQSTSLEKSTQTPKPLCSELQPSSMHWLGGSVVELAPVQLVCCTCGSKV